MIPTFPRVRIPLAHDGGADHDRSTGGRGRHDLQPCPAPEVRRYQQTIYTNDVSCTYRPEQRPAVPRSGYPNR